MIDSSGLYGVFKGDQKSGALFSEDGKYRWMLWRVWDNTKPFLHFCMLNPSTADEIENDATIERCERRAKTMGYGGLYVTNIFAYRSTNPKRLMTVRDPVGLWNVWAIIEASQNCDLTICGWGRHGKIKNQGKKILDQLVFWKGNSKVKALKINGDGSPAHPLYIGYDVKPIPIDLKSK